MAHNVGQLSKQVLISNIEQGILNVEMQIKYFNIQNSLLNIQYSFYRLVTYFSKAPQ